MVDMNLFSSLVQRSGRLRVRSDLTDLVPFEVRAEMAGRAAWLRSQLPGLDSELGAFFPPIDVVPVCWRLGVEESDMGFVHGRVTLLPREDSWVLGLELSGASVRALSDDLLLGNLAHEFLHYVHATVSVSESARTGVATFGPGVGYLDDWTSYQRLDRASQVPAEVWLSKRLAGLADRIEGRSPDEIDTALISLWRGWVEAGYPTERPDVHVEKPAVTIVIDEALVAKARDLRQRAIGP
jgi:hypothetical protein